MDKLGLINDLYRIKGFDLIEKSIDVPLLWLDTIRGCIANRKSQGCKYTDFGTIARSLVHDEMDMGIMDDICTGIVDKYTNKCIYLNHLYTEWKVTDLLSSIVCCFQISTFIEKISNDKKREKGIRTYLYNGQTCATNIYTNDSNIIFDPTKRYHEKPIQKDMDLDNPDSFDLLVANIMLNNTFDICLVAEKNDETTEIVFPLVGYKVLIEEGLKEGDEEYDVLSVSIVDLGLDFTINE